MHFIVSIASYFKLQKDKSWKNLLSEYFHDERNQKGNFSGFIDFGDGYVGHMFETLISVWDVWDVAT